MSALLREAPKEPCARAPFAAYGRRDPEATVLHEAVRTHLETLLAGEDAEWWSLVVPAKPLGTLLPKPRSRRIAWADLLRRVFALELLVCACGGRRRVIATIEEGPVARKILRHLGLPDTAPVLVPARHDQTDLWPTGPPPNDACDPPFVEDVQRSPPDFAA